MSLRFRGGKNITLTPDGIGDIILSNDTINPTAAQNVVVGTLSVFVDDASPFSWSQNNTKFELSSASGSSVNLERSATGSLTAGGTETVIVTVIDSEARVFPKTFTIDVDTVTIDIFISNDEIPPDIASGGTVGQLSAVGGKAPVVFTNSPANTKFTVSSSGLVTRSATGTLTDAVNETISIDATDANGNVFEEDILIIVDDGVSAPVTFTTPDPPAWGRAVTLAGNFPTTVTASNVPGIAVSEAFTNMSAYKSRMTSLGNQIITNVASGFVDDIGSATDNAWVAPWTVDGGPTAHTTNFQTARTGQVAGQVAYIKGFKVGPADSILNQSRAYALNSVGPYALQPGDPITQGSTTGTVLSYTNDSGVVASGTGVGRLVVSAQFGSFSAASFNSGANTDVGTFVSGSFRYGPQYQGSGIVQHHGFGGMYVVGCHIRNCGTSSAGIQVEGEDLIHNSDIFCHVYDTTVSWCGSAGTDTVHNIYAHYCDLAFIRSVSRDCPSGHVMKAETHRVVMLDSAMVRFSGDIDGIANIFLSSGSASGSIPLNGPWVSSGAVTIPLDSEGRYQLVRIVCEANNNSRWFVVTGTDANDVVITERIRGVNGGRCWTNRQYKTVTALSYETITTQQAGQVWIGWGYGTAQDQKDVDFSAIQNKRVARCLFGRQQVGESGGAPAVGTSRRTSKFAGFTPDGSPMCFDGDGEIGTGGNLVPWAQNLMNGDDSPVMIAGTLQSTHAASATDFHCSAWQYFEQDNQLLTPNLFEPDINYDIRAQRNDGTILSFTATVTNATFTADAGTDRITYTGLTGYAGVIPDNTWVTLTTSGSLSGTGLAVSTRYFFQHESAGVGFLTTSSNGSTPINITGAGTGTHKIHLFARNPAGGGVEARFPIGGVYGTTQGGNNNRLVALKKSSNSWDTALLHHKLFNRASPDYMFAADGPCLTGGILDFSKQSNFEPGYFEDCMFMCDSTQPMSLFTPEPRWYHGFYVLSTLSVELPKPPINRPQGQWSIPFTSGSMQILVGQGIVGATSGATGTVGGYRVTTGTVAGGDAAGTIYLTATTGTFVSENLNVELNLNVATVSSSFPRVQDWPDIGTAGTFTEPGIGSGYPFWGRNPTGYINNFDRGPNSDYTQLHPDLFKNIGYHIEDSRLDPTDFFHFGGYTAAGNPGSITNSGDNPDTRFVNTAGILTAVTEANRSPLNVSSYTRLNGAHASGTKLYVTATTGFTAGKRVMMELPLRAGSAEALYIGTVVSTSSDGGGPFVNVTPTLPRAAVHRSRICAFTPGGADPTNWISPDDYGTL